MLFHICFYISLRHPSLKSYKVYPSTCSSERFNVPRPSSNTKGRDKAWQYMVKWTWPIIRTGISMENLAKTALWAGQDDRTRMDCLGQNRVFIKCTRARWTGNLVYKELGRTTLSQADLTLLKLGNFAWWTGQHFSKIQ